MAELPLAYEACDGWRRRGRVTGIDASMLTVRMPALTSGACIGITTRDSQRAYATAQSVSESGARCAAIGSLEGIAIGAEASSDLERLGAFVGEELFGKAVDAWGRAPGASARHTATVEPPPLDLADRARISKVMRTGVGAIDTFTPLGYGQRVSLAAGAGVGKTTLLRAIVEHADVDARVVALVGERARDALEFIERLERGPRWRNTTVVCAGAEAPPMERLAAARTATAQAEWLRCSGRRVLLAVDSLTRVAAAWREVAAGCGEPLALRGYPASLVGVLARLVERAGAWPLGSITGIYVVLVDADDLFEPVTDSVRSLLDGQVILSRRLADAGRYPAIDVLRSLSRIMPTVVSAEHCRDAALVRRAIATLEEAQDLLAVGAYRPGADPWLDACVALRPDIDQLRFEAASSEADALPRLAALAEKLAATAGQAQSCA